MELFNLTLPLWQGVSEKIEQCLLLDFELYIDEYGLIRQRQSDAVSKKIEAAYAEDSYRYITLPAGHSDWANQQLTPKLDFILKCLPNFKQSRVLEIGAGSTFLGEKLHKDFDLSSYVVVDPSVRERSDCISVIRDYFSYEIAKDLNVDYVLSLSCLEHVPDPIVFLKDINKLLLSRHGEAVILFPDVSRQFRSGDINVLLHEHLTYFTKEAVVELFPILGFEILALDIDQDLLKLHVRAVRDPDNIIRVRAEYDLLQEFNRKLNDNINRIKAQLEKSIAERKIIGFHGACNGLNNLLATLGIQNFSNIKILDGDSKKAGKFISVCPKPICSASLENYQDVDIVFVSAMTFYQPIYQFLTQQLDIDPRQIFPLCSLQE